MNMLDWILAGLAAFSVVRGLMRGAVSQIFGIAGILAGFYVASHKYEQVGAEIHNYFQTLSGTGPIAFILLFILTWFCIAAVGFWIGRLMRSAGLGFLDRIWGGMIGFGKALLIAIAAVSILTLFGAKDTPLLTGSALVPYINEATGFLLKMAPDRVQTEFSKKRQNLKNYLLDKTALPRDRVSESVGPDRAKSGKKE